VFVVALVLLSIAPHRHDSARSADGSRPAMASSGADCALCDLLVAPRLAFAPPLTALVLLIVLLGRLAAAPDVTHGVPVPRRRSRAPPLRFLP
jgi:hypothetical protein